MNKREYLFRIMSFQEKACKSDWLALSGLINKNYVRKDTLSKLMTYKSSRRAKDTFKK